MSIYSIGTLSMMQIFYWLHEKKMIEHKNILYTGRPSDFYFFMIDKKKYMYDSYINNNKKNLEKVTLLVLMIDLDNNLDYSDYFKKFESFERKKLIIGYTNNKDYKDNNLNVNIIINFKTEKGFQDFYLYLSNIIS